MKRERGPDAVGHGQGQRRDQVTGAGAHHGGPEHAIAALLQQGPAGIPPPRRRAGPGDSPRGTRRSRRERFPAPPLPAGPGRRAPPPARCRCSGARPAGRRGALGKKSAFWTTTAAWASARWGEVGRGRHVAGGEDAGVRRAQLRVDLDAAGIAADADFLESQPFDVGRPAHGHQEVVADRFPLLALAVDPGEPDAAGLGAPPLRSSRRGPGRRRRGEAPVRPGPAASGSSRGRMPGSTSKVVTRLPSRTKACESSQPIGPAPMTASRSGRSVRAKTVSLVR